MANEGDSRCRSFTIILYDHCWINLARHSSGFSGVLSLSSRKFRDFSSIGHPLLPLFIHPKLVLAGLDGPKEWGGVTLRCREYRWH